MRSVAVPRRYLAEPKETDAYRAMMSELRHRAGFGAPILMHGPRGTGKTFAACQLLRERLASESDLDAARGVGRYIRLGEYFDALKAGFDNPQSGERSVTSRYVRPALLIVDECHDVLGSDWQMVEFGTLVDKRYGAMKPTVLVTNAEPSEWVAVFGQSVLDRCRDGGFIAVGGDSWRGVK